MLANPVGRVRHGSYVHAMRVYPHSAIVLNLKHNRLSKTSAKAEDAGIESSLCFVVLESHNKKGGNMETRTKVIDVGRRILVEQPVQPISGHEVLQRWPRIVANLICDSLGYFSPMGAANAIADHVNERECWCELYISFLRSDKAMLAIGEERLRNAIRSRHRHRGFMADYRAARLAVAHERNGNGPIFMSW